MKKISTLALALLTLTQLMSCGTDKKSDKEVKKSDASYVLNKAKNKIVWTAYKFTEKTPVKGQFRKINITGGGEGTTPNLLSPSAAYLPKIRREIIRSKSFSLGSCKTPSCYQES